MPARPTHRYPHGRPWPLLVVQIFAGCVGVLWVIYGLRSWPITVGIIATALALVYIHARLNESYERAGRAVRIPRHEPSELAGPLPPSMRILRYVALVLIGLVLFFGLAPMSEHMAWIGIIASIVMLMLCSGIYIVLGWWHMGDGSDSTDVL